MINVSETTPITTPTEIIKTELIERTASKKRGRKPKPKIKEVDTDEEMIEEIPLPTNKENISTAQTFEFNQTNNNQPFTFGQAINDKSTYDNKAGIDYKGVNQLFK